VTGLSPGQLRDAGGFDYLLGVVELMLSPERVEKLASPSSDDSAQNPGPGDVVSIPRVAS
jgi:hypothetical protein